MKRAVVLLGMALLLPTAAQSQQTNCQFIGNQMYCNTTQPRSQIVVPPIQQFDLGAALLQGERLRAARAAREAQEADRAREQSQAMHEREAAYLRSEVGRMVSEGDCDGAKKMALRYGNLEVAAQVATLCK